METPGFETDSLEQCCRFSKKSNFKSQGHQHEVCYQYGKAIFFLFFFAVHRKKKTLIEPKLDSALTLALRKH